MVIVVSFPIHRIFFEKCMACFLRSVFHRNVFCREESGICDLIFALLCSVLLVQDYISFWSALAMHSSVCVSIAIVPLKM